MRKKIQDTLEKEKEEMIKKLEEMKESHDPIIDSALTEVDQFITDAQ